jgi:cyclopropane fatty-acyl-phospholipid synthase-like methyltransferase
MNIAFSQACENNKQPILNELQRVFSKTKRVLEVGSGTGQHSVFFAEHLPQLAWQPSDLLINHDAINHRRSCSDLSNMLAPIVLDLHQPWKSVIKKSSLQGSIDGIFTANTLHIVSSLLVDKFFTGVKQNLVKGGLLCIYGPFNYQGKFTSASNERFDLWLKDRDEESGIRDFEHINELALNAGVSLLSDTAMPANNRLLVFMMN